MLPEIPDLRLAGELRTSRRTLFVFDSKRDEWWISTWRGEEVRLAVADLEEFFRHCLHRQRDAKPRPPRVD